MREIDPCAKYSDLAGGSQQIGGYTDQLGSRVTKEHMLRLISESMLANVMAFEEAGVPLKDLKQALGRDGGIIVGRGVVFRTPIEERLSDRDAREFVKRYSGLVSEYSKNRLDHGFLDNVKLRNGVSSKVSMIRASLRKRNG